MILKLITINTSVDNCSHRDIITTKITLNTHCNATILSPACADVAMFDGCLPTVPLPFLPLLTYLGTLVTSLEAGICEYERGATSTGTSTLVSLLAAVVFVVCVVSNGRPFAVVLPHIGGGLSENVFLLFSTITRVIFMFFCCIRSFV